MKHPSTELTLHTTLKSAPGRKVLAFCHHVGLEPRVHSVDVYGGEGQAASYRTIHPFGKVPSLVHDGFVLWESNAILMYVAEALDDYRLSSREPARRADLLRYLFWETAHLMPSFGPVLATFVGTCLREGRAAADPEAIEWRQEPFWSYCRYLDGVLSERSYVAGDALSVADFALAGMFTYARAARFPFHDVPRLARWQAEVFGLEGFARTEHPLWAAP